jgi:hypothetical protein
MSEFFSDKWIYRYIILDSFAVSKSSVKFYTYKMATTKKLFSIFRTTFIIALDMMSITKQDTTVMTIYSFVILIIK